MKRLMITAAVTMLALASCKKETETTPEATPPVEDTTPAPAPQPQASSSTTTTTTTTTTSEKEPDGTSISVGDDGFSLQSKKGDNENNVTVNKKQTTVTVEKKTE
jgi:nitrous oxide reductase accessory protein NosL